MGGFLGWRHEAKHQREQALALHGRNGEPAAKLSAWPLAPSAGSPEDLTCTTKACNPVLPEFVTYEAACLTWGKQLPQPCPWRSRSCICLRPPHPRGHGYHGDVIAG